MTIFTEFLRALEASVSVQGRKVLLLVDNCVTHLQDTALLRNVKVVHFPRNCTTLICASNNSSSSFTESTQQ
jgi:hypothetical protein